MHNSKDLPAPWLCNVCSRDSVSKEKIPRGLFQQLLPGVRTKNPRAFTLPNQVRGYFEGVRTGEDGEYEESHDVKQNKSVNISFSISTGLCTNQPTGHEPGTRKSQTILNLETAKRTLFCAFAATNLLWGGVRLSPVTSAFYPTIWTVSILPLPILQIRKTSADPGRLGCVQTMLIRS